MGKGGGRGGRTSNDGRSDSMNPNNPEYKGDDEDEED